MSEYKGQGFESFSQSGGLSSQERAIDRENTLTFRERAEKLMEHAEKVVHQARAASLVRGLLQKIGGIGNLTEDVCERFAEENPQYFDEGPVILAIALALEKERKSDH